MQATYTSPVAESHVHSHGAGQSLPGIQCCVPQHAPQPVPRTLYSEPEHRRTHRHDAQSGRTVQGTGGKIAEAWPKQFCRPTVTSGTGLSTGLLLYCIGTLSILGPINAALLGDNTFLYTNATLDLVTSAVLATTYGAGMALAAPVLFCWQGSIWLLARLCGNIIPPELLTEMSIVGGTLIAASGLSILEIKDCKTLNLLPSLFIPVLFFLGKSLI